jgi:CheY-like chemotaxis protein
VTTSVQVKSVPFLSAGGEVLMSTKTVLLIEHEASIREVLHTCLSEFGGWRVTLSNSIQEGIALCMATCPDAILIDASASETDALIFIEQLKQHSMTQSIPIVLITARASWFTPKQLHQMGFAGAITKPFNPSILPAQISHLLGWSATDL